MEHIIIRCPIWATRSVGIAVNKIVDDICVEVDYRDKSGNKVFPGQYFMKKEKALSYPIQVLPKVTLKIIPISDFEVLSDWKKENIF